MIIREKDKPYKPLNERTKEELLEYKSRLEMLIAMDEALYGPWHGYHLFELGRVEKELKRRGIVMNKELELIKENHLHGLPVDEQELNNAYDTVEKELNALKIIKNKRVDIELFIGCDKWEEYAVRCENYADLNIREYNLLKEVLLDE